MFKVRAKTRFSIVFSIYVFLVIVAFSVLFLGTVFIVRHTQGLKELRVHATEIIIDHLELSSDSYDFKLNDDGVSLREYLITNNLSAVFLDEAKTIKREYGIFALDDSLQKQLLHTGLNMDSVNFQRLTYQGRLLDLGIFPLKTNDRLIGYLIISPSSSDQGEIYKVILLTLALLSVFALVGSLLIGRFLFGQAYRQLNHLLRVTEDVDLDELDQAVPVEGHPDDEVSKLSQKFNQMLGRLKTMSLNQKSFISNASHELKSPLTRVISSLELLDPNDSNFRDEISKIKEDLFDLNETIDNLFIVSKLNPKQKSFQQKFLIIPKQIINRLQNKFESQLQIKKIKFSPEFSENFYAAIPPKQLEIVLSNLLSNSIKYTPYGGVVNLVFTNQNGQTTISVSDNGIGIPESMHQKIFERFFRHYHQQDVNGAGIGLSIVKQICDFYQIKTKIISEVGKGSQIILMLTAAND